MLALRTGQAAPGARVLAGLIRRAADLAADLTLGAASLANANVAGIAAPPAAHRSREGAAGAPALVGTRQQLATTNGTAHLLIRTAGATDAGLLRPAAQAGADHLADRAADTLLADLLVDRLFAADTGADGVVGRAADPGRVALLARRAADTQASVLALRAAAGLAGTRIETGFALEAAAE